ncbi:MAG TPA: DsbA family protein, partial [Candidatus Thermoplasmatota archaeon]|nr:DsbA family protein [Candidatus Thermoplasmatota archaeon]
AVYDDVAHYREQYEIERDEDLAAWAREGHEAMDVPMLVDLKVKDLPATMLPATLAVMAARRQDGALEPRFTRELLRRFVVEGRDVTDETELLDAAKVAGLDVERFRKDWKDQDGLRADVEGQGRGWPHVPIGFYNLVVTDGHRHVILDHAFDPALVEGAIDYLSGGTLAKAEPKDVAAYLAMCGPTPLAEVQKVFRLAPKDAEQRLVELEKAGKARARTIAGARFWEAA